MKVDICGMFLLVLVLYFRVGIIRPGKMLFFLLLCVRIVCHLHHINLVKGGIIILVGGWGVGRGVCK